MENLDFDKDLYREAKKQVKEIKGFYSHLASYVMVIVVLMVINLSTSREYLWFLWPVLGWGIGLALHGIAVFNVMPFFGRDWEQRKIQELLNKQKHSKWE
jgi:hypothetical protein